MKDPTLEELRAAVGAPTDAPSPNIDGAQVEVIRRARKARTDRAGVIIERAQAEQRDFLASDQREFDGLVAEVRELDELAETLGDRLGREARAASVARHLEGANVSTETRNALGYPSVVIRENSQSAQLTYRAGENNSYFRDLYRATLRHDFGASERLGQHREQVGRVMAEFRDINRTDTSGGEFVPPLWLIDRYAAVARAGRTTADLMQAFMLPPGTDSINIPRVTTGATTATQSDNAAVSETDLLTASVEAPVRTIAGQQDASIQLLEQSPISMDEVIFRDLIGAYAANLDTQVINGNGTAPNHRGILNVTGITTVTYTDASPTLSELYAKLADGVNQMSTTRYLPPTAVVMHPRRWAWMLSALDTSNRPLVVPSAYGPANASAVSFGLDPSQAVGTLLGLGVYIDANVPTNLGAGTNEDRILMLRAEDHFLFESMIKTRVLPDVGSGTLTVRLQVYAYSAFTAGRYPASVVVISGSGLVAPSF